MNINHSKSIEPVPVVLIVPLSANYAMPSLAVSILKTSLREKGIMSRVFYANMLFFELIGSTFAEKLFYGSINNLLFERLFAPYAYSGLTQDLDELNGDEIPAHLQNYYDRVGGVNKSISKEMFATAKAKCEIFLQKATEWIVNLNPQVIGISNPYQQTNVSVALARSVKQRLPHVLSTVGGNNCDGEMGEEIAASMDIFDYVFQGEADFVFAEFCFNYLERNILPKEKLIKCPAPTNLDALPLPDFNDFFEQSLIPREKLIIPFESSRGCWWGHKNQCRFCGNSALSIPYRIKTPERTIRELRILQDNYPGVHNYCATDLIFPASYFKNFLSELASIDFHGKITYELRADLPYVQQVKQLKKAGITRIFPGIESLSTRLLKKMHKGTNALTNILFLRRCRELGIVVAWNFLLGIPDDRASDYDEQARIIPYIQHLSPPELTPLSIRRFSPYFNDPESYDIINIEPLSSYRHAFPESINLSRLAYFFSACYPSESRQRPDILGHLLDLIKKWNARWLQDEFPTLSIMQGGRKQWIIKDSRDCAKVPDNTIGGKDYFVLCECRSGDLPENITYPERIDQLLDFGYLIEVDGKLLSVVCEIKNSE